LKHLLYRPEPRRKTARHWPPKIRPLAVTPSSPNRKSNQEFDLTQIKIALTVGFWGCFWPEGHRFGKV
jgi:hypothetical protein